MRKKIVIEVITMCRVSIGNNFELGGESCKLISTISSENAAPNYQLGVYCLGINISINFSLCSSFPLLKKICPPFYPTHSYSLQLIYKFPMIFLLIQFNSYGNSVILPSFPNDQAFIVVGSLIQTRNLQ